MTRSPRVIPTLPFFLLKLPLKFHRSGASCASAITIGLGLTLSCSAALAQSPPRIARAHQGRHLGGRRRIDQSQYRHLERLADHRPRLRRDALHASSTRSMPTTSRSSGWWELSARILPRRRGHAGGGRRHHVSDRVVERGARHRRPHRQAVMDASIRRSTARRATRAAATWSIAVSRSGRARCLSRAYDGRLFALDAVTGKVVWEKDTIVEQGAFLHRHRRAARVQRQGRDRQWRCRIRRPRLRHRL